MSAELFSKNVKNIFERRRAALYMLAVEQAGRMINYFRKEKAGGAFWQNQTGDAAKMMFSGATFEKDVVSMFMAHGVDYGPYLELSNDGKHAAIEPVMNIYRPIFIKKAQELFRDR